MQPIELKTGSTYWQRIGFLWGMFFLIGFALSAVARRPVMGIFGLVLMFAPALLLLNRRFTWVARLDSEGVVMRSGKRHAWRDFEKVIAVHAVKGGARWHNHYALIFKSGRGRIFDRMLANAPEVLAVVQMLEQGNNPFTGTKKPGV